MTSQMVLFNQAGVAISTDTLVSRRYGHGAVKTYPGSSKIYALGPLHKVVVLHSGTTILGNLHYQFLIREWSLQLAQPLPHLVDYARNFAEWVGAGARKTQIQENGEGGTINDCMCAELRDLKNFFSDQLTEAFGKCESVEASPELESSLTEILDSYESDYFTREPYQDLDEQTVARIIRNADIDATRHFNQHFPSKNYSETMKARLQKFAVDLLLRYVPGDSVAKLNFVGFGSDEPGGGIVEIAIRSFYAGKLRYVERDRWPEDGSIFPTWRFIAQKDTMDAFLRGIDSNMRSTVIDLATWSMINSGEFPEEQIDSFRETFKREMDKFLWERIESEMVETVGSLGIASLARFSDSLVRMQSLRSAALGDEATVGGLIETVTITRDNGVQWLRRIPLDVSHGEESGHVFG